jgi:hypothetical protein
MSPATKLFKLEKIFTYGRQSHTVSVDVPMCDQHYEVASFKGTAERLVGMLGVAIGILFGLFAAVMLILRWRGTGEGNIILNLLVAGIFGLGMFLIVWAVFPYPSRLILPTRHPRKRAMRYESHTIGRRINL